MLVLCFSEFFFALKFSHRNFIYHLLSLEDRKQITTAAEVLSGFQKRFGCFSNIHLTAVNSDCYGGKHPTENPKAVRQQTLHGEPVAWPGCCGSAGASPSHLGSVTGSFLRTWFSEGLLPGPFPKPVLQSWIFSL